MHCSVEDAEVIYRDATTLELVDAGYAWIVTEQALLPHNTPIGCLSLICSVFLYLVMHWTTARVGAQGHCRISPPRFLAECHKS